MTWLSDVSGASCRSQKKGLRPTNESRFSLLKSILSLELRGSAPAQPSSERFPDSSIKLSQAWSPKRASVGSAASMRRHSPFRRRCQSCAATRTYAAVVNRAPPLAPPPPLSIVRRHSPLRFATCTSASLFRMSSHFYRYSISRSDASTQLYACRCPIPLRLPSLLSKTRAADASPASSRTTPPTAS